MSRAFNLLLVSRETFAKFMKRRVLLYAKMEKSGTVTHKQKKIV